MLLELIKKRHSGRSYDRQRQVTKNQITEIIEVARWTPSCFGDEPWRYIICEKQSESWNKVFNCLAEGNKIWAINCPVFIISISAKKFRNPDAGDNRWGAYDTGASTYAMVLAATEMGLMAHEMGGFDQEMVIKEFEIPNEFSPMAVIALGYEEKSAQPVPRTRKPVNELFFYNEWQNT